jgi:hypothetical protein
MAILILGKTKCPICGAVMQDGQKTVSCPPFVGNELDPLYLFHDAAFHEECFRRHPLAETAGMLLREMQAKTAPRNRRCAVCEQPINDPDDYFSLGHLVTDKAHALFPFNYALFHRSCLPKWSQRAYVKDLLIDLQASGKWQGESLEWILDRL